MVDDKTRAYSFDKIKNGTVRKTLQDVAMSLDARGYNPINQMVGYLISGDPGYISNYQDARAKLTSLDRNKVIEELLRTYLGEE